MDGYPKNLNTKQDYEYVRNHFSKEQWEGDFRDLLTSSKDWFNVGKITGNGVTDDTHKVVVDEGIGGAPSATYQYELRENPDAKIFRIGYTVEEVEKILA